MTQEKLFEIASHFALEGKIASVEALGEGFINDTFVVKSEGSAPDYILQRKNHIVFPDVPGMMDNIKAVTEHIKAKVADPMRETLTVVPAKDGKLYYKDGENYWAVCLFIPETITYDRADSTSLAYQGGVGIGRFQALLADFDKPLNETIKGFHNIRWRFEQWDATIAADPVGRVAEPEVQAMLKEIDARAEYMCQAERMGREGVLPKRVCHCDTKVNNMMFDQQDNVLCVIDLDTVMPNFIFSDYGDFLRTGANKVAEDFQDMDAVCFDVDIFKAFTEGYLASASSFLTRVEIENLPYAVKLFPYMQCVRFLWDYLSGDKYWKCQYANHNFVRANNQLHLLFSIEKHEPEMEAFIADCLK